MKKRVLLILCLWLVPGETRAGGAPAGELFCGEPILLARMEALHLPLQKWPEERLLEFLNASSAARVKEVRLALGEMTGEETAVYERIKASPAPVVHRTRFERLRSILSSGALYSPAEAQKKGDSRLLAFSAERKLRGLKRFYPELSRPEETQDPDVYLSGREDCIYATVGPVDGYANYGDVVFRLNGPKVRAASWATPWDAYQFLENFRKRNLQPSADDRLAYADTVFTGGDWPEILALMVISRARAGTDSGGTLKALAEAKDADALYELIRTGKLGSLESKTPREIPLTAVDAIVVDCARLREVLAWPESAKWREKIMPRPGVPCAR